jgi:hypothetical protein
MKLERKKWVCAKLPCVRMCSKGACSVGADVPTSGSVLEWGCTPKGFWGGWVGRVGADHVASALPNIKSSVLPNFKNNRTLCPRYTFCMIVADLCSSANRSSACRFKAFAIRTCLTNLRDRYPRKVFWIITAAVIGVHRAGSFGLYLPHNIGNGRR